MKKFSLFYVFFCILMANTAQATLPCIPDKVQTLTGGNISSDSMNFQMNQEVQKHYNIYSEIYNVDFSHCNQTPYQYSAENLQENPSGGEGAAFAALIFALNEVYGENGVGVAHLKSVAEQLGKPVITYTEYENELMDKGERPRYKKGISTWEAENLKVTKAAGSDKLYADGKNPGVADSGKTDSGKTNKGKDSVADSRGNDLQNLTSTQSSQMSTSVGDIKDSKLMSTLTMTAVGFLTARLHTCKQTTDVMAAGLAGGLFVAGEVVHYSKIKKELKGFTQTYSLENNEEKQKQLEVFYKLRSGYEKAISTSDSKVKLQQSSAFAFAGAAAAAGILEGTNKGAKAACLSAINSSSGSCAAATMSGAGAAVAPLQAAQGQVTSMSLTAEALGPSSQKATEVDSYIAALTTNLSTASGVCPAAATAQSACSKFIGIVKKNMAICKPASLMALNETKIKKDFLAFLSNLLIPEAQAATSLAAMGISGAAGHFVLASQKALATKVDTFLASPLKRAIIWGSLAAIAYKASADSKDVIKQLEGNIALIDDIIKDLESNGLGESGEGTKEDPVAKTPPANPNNNPNGPGSNTPKRENVVNDKANVITLDNPTNCLAGTVSGTCATIESAIKSSDGFEYLDPATQELLIGQSKKMEALNGVSQIPTMSLDKLGGMGAGGQRAINDLRGDLVNKYKIPKSSLSEMDKVTRDLLKTTQGELKGQTPRAMYASMGGIPPLEINGMAATPKIGEELKQDLAPLEFESDGLNNSFTTSSSSAFGGGASKKDELVAKKEAEDILKNGAIDMSQMGDITPKEKNIFNVITERYQKSGYTRLFSIGN